MRAEEKELINEKFSGVHSLLIAQSDVLHAELNEIKTTIKAVHDETKRTNGRVTSIENDIKVTRFMETHPKIFALIILLFIGVLKIDYIIELIKYLI